VTRGVPAAGSCGRNELAKSISHPDHIQCRAHASPNLDLDVGPLLQTQKLLDSVEFARSRGYPGVLTAAELEMMNLTGDGNGLAIVTMPPEWRNRVPTSNFFQQGGYERNPIASRNNVVAKLLAATNAVMDKESQLPGAKELAAYFPR
jgi:hypothetical protein